MPYIHVTSSVSRSGVDAAATKRSIAEAAVKALDRVLPQVAVKLDLEQDIVMFAGEPEEHCAFIHLRSVGRVDAEYNPKTAALLSEAVAENLKLPLNRVFFHLEDISPSNWGVSGKTFA